MPIGAEGTLNDFTPVLDSMNLKDVILTKSVIVLQFLTEFNLILSFRIDNFLETKCK